MPRVKLTGGATVLLAAVAVALAGCRGPATAGKQATAVPRSPRTNSSSWPRHFVDDLGRSVNLPAPPRRVISLSPNMAEIVCFIGASDLLVGVTDFCDYPPEAAAKPKVGGIINPSLEKIIALKPDLILAAQGNDIAFLDKLRSRGIPVYAARARTLADVLDLILTIGSLLGREADARVAVDRLRAQITALTRCASALHTHPRALCVIELDPLFVAGPGSFIDDLLTRAGMTNAVSSGRAWTRWSSERLIASDPDLIILVSGPHAARPARLKTLSPWRELRAVKSGLVFEVDEDLLTIPGPRLVQGLEKLVTIHERYEAITSANSRAGPGGE